MIIILLKKLHDLLVEFHDFSMTFQAWKIPSMTFQYVWEPYCLHDENRQQKNNIV